MRKIYLFAIPIILIISYMLLSNHGIEIQSTGLVLRETNNNKIVLVDKEGETVVDGVMGFNLSQRLFYGWAQNGDIKYFAINREDSKVSFFRSLGELNSYLEEQNQPLLNMSKEITYWDLEKKKIRKFRGHDT